MPAAIESLSTRRQLRSAALVTLARWLGSRLDRLEWHDAQSAGRAIGRLSWALAGRDRTRTLAHLEIAFPELPRDEVERLGRESFLHLGTLIAELLYLSERGAGEVRRRVAVEGWSIIEEARAARRPVLVASGHCGNWELIHAALNERGLGMSVVARGMDDERVHETLLSLRRSFGTTTVVRGAADSARELLRALRSRGALAMLIDQDTAVESVWVDFFGRPARTPSGAAEIAARFRAAVLPVFSERLADGSHLVRIHPALDLSADTVVATQAMTSAIEAQIRRVPEQWVWMHRRWRRQPPAERG
jgi:KDO2-lipid IV(A) lauroyltransferase